MPTKLLRLLIAISALLAGLRVAFYGLATVYQPSDDEGYMLISIKHYMAGGHLYTQVFSQYGPIYFFAESLLFHLFHQPLTHDGGRRITLLLWVASALLAAWFLYRISRNLLVASATVLVLLQLSAAVLVNEPNHPQHLILFLLMLACCVSLSQRPLELFLMGAIGTALLFIKINVGIFFFVALFSTLVVLLPRGVLRKIGGAFFIVYFLFGPILLMRRELHTWTGFYILAILLGSSVFLTALLTFTGSAKARSTIPYLIGGIATGSLAVILAAMLQGISFHTLLEGVFLDPLRQPGLFELPAYLSRGPSAAVFATVGCACAIYYWQRSKQRKLGWISLVRCAAGLLFIGTCLSDSPVHVSALLLVLPLGLLPANCRSWDKFTFSRIFVTLLAATELLQNFPVVGSQRIISAAPVVLWSFLAIWDAGVELTRRFPALEQPRNPFPSIGVILGSVLILLLEVSVLRNGKWKPSFPYPPSALRGSGSLHLAPQTETTYLALAQGVNRNCDLLFTLPGMDSFNLWSDELTPNGQNMTVWVKGLPQPRQQEILHILESDSNACVIVKPQNRWHVTDADLAASPLASYILHDMPRVSLIDGYQIRVNPHRTSRWEETASSATSTP